MYNPSFHATNPQLICKTARYISLFFSSSLLFLFYLSPWRDGHPAAAESQRGPAANHTQPAERRDGAEGLEARRVEDEQVDGAREHGHAGRQQRHGQLVLRRRDRGEEDDARVDELLGDV